ncbi:MalY/PatB family protein [uncultured Anaerococcus sp.]|uniref:MalY/PatB family protein n=1 Tax=uncultured Anaerococcus sp. TaxID=293428 RepID=UPI002632A11F|nr:PatB family C-S lyase [uncultured Anaerococcus sp.]
MKYNFDQVIDRSGTNAMKLEGYKQYIFHADDSLVLPYKDEDFIHLWVADMEFGVAPEILDAIRARLDKQILGYTQNSDSRLYDALSSWCKKMYDFDFNKDDLMISNGVVPAIKRIISYTLNDGEKVLFTTPSYGQFAAACVKNNKEYVKSDLIKDEDGYYNLDFEDLEEKMKRDDVKLFILCNPHNPTGRAWSKEELTRIADLIRKYDLWVISDEIHCDLRRENTAKHIPLAKIMDDYDKIITCMSASKSFNIAGLAQSSILIRNEELKEKWLFDSGNSVNPLSHEATIAAYTKADQWLLECNKYLDENFKFLNNFLEDNLADAIVTQSETTYLAWVDFSKYFEKDENLELFFAKEAGVLIEADKAFVDNANRMVRLNIACPRFYLEEGLNRMADAIDKKN